MARGGPEGQGGGAKSMQGYLLQQKQALQFDYGPDVDLSEWCVRAQSISPFGSHTST